jgi:hypothetical protein
VTFNDHAGSTKSYDYVREHNDLYKRCLAMNPDDAMARHELDYFAHLRSNQATSPSSPH